MLSVAIALPLCTSGGVTNENAVYAADEKFTYGDVNNDGIINILDMISLKSYLLENNKSNFSVKAADVDDDGTVSSKDIVELSMYLLEQIGSFSYEKNIDSDEDGLCDYIEKEVLGTDPYKADTDGDGLSDYTEIYYCNTDPLSIDTGNTGIKDCDKDADNDTLTNLEEIKLGTSPASADTDEDGLSDYDEVKKYKTDPLNEDTDGDKISDYGELKLGLDPLKNMSDGKISDTDIVFDQKMIDKEVFLNSLYSEDSPFSISIQSRCSGYIGDSLDIGISEYTNYLSSEVILGDILDFDYSDDFSIEELTINFELKDEYLAEEYMVFKYSEELNMIFPMETTYNGNILTVTDDCDGTFCIIEMNKWIEQSGFSDSEYVSSSVKTANQLSLFSNNVKYDLSYNNVSSSDNESIDIYFVLLYKEYYYEQCLNQLSKATREILDYCNKVNKQVRIHFITYLGGAVYNTRTGNQYITNDDSDEDIQKMFKKSSCVSPESAEKLKLINVLNKGITPLIKEYEKSTKYCYVLDGRIYPSCNNDISDISRIMSSVGVFRFICDPYNNNLDYYNALSLDYTHYNINDDFSETIFDEVIRNIKIYTYNVNIASTKKSNYNLDLITEDWKEAFEKFYSSDLNSEDKKKLADEFLKAGFPDSDGDGMCDCLEINMRLITFDENGNIVLPTYGQMEKLFGKPFVNMMKKKGINLENVLILPLFSNPLVEDSDFDGIIDVIDLAPIKENDTTVDDSLLNDSDIFSNSYKTISSKSVDGGGILSSRNETKKNNVIQYSRNVDKNVRKVVSVFYISPKNNSDYLITTDLGINDYAKIAVLEVSQNKKIRKQISEIEMDEWVKSTEQNGNTITNRKAFKLDAYKNYKIVVTVESDNVNTQRPYNISIEQNNWVYAPYGAVRHLFTNSTSYLDDWYLTDDYIYQLMEYTVSRGNSIKNKKEILKMINDSEEDTRDFLRSGSHTKRIYSLFNTSNEDILNLNNKMGEIATETGVLSTAILSQSAKEVIKNIGDSVGVISTYFSGAVLAISKVGDLREKSLEDALYYGKLNICFRSQRIEGYNLLPVSSFSSWNTSKYVNKYYDFAENIDGVRYKKRERCDTIPFKSIDMYISNDGVTWEKQ